MLVEEVEEVKAHYLTLILAVSSCITHGFLGDFEADWPVPCIAKGVSNRTWFEGFSSDFGKISKERTDRVI